MPPDLRPDATTPAPPNCSCLPRRHHPGGSFLTASDHASSSPLAGYCRGRASVRLACVYAGSGAAAFLAATCPGLRLRPPSPTPGERSSCRSGGSQPLLAALTTLPVCLGFVPTTQAGTRQPFDVASLSASTAPVSFLAGGGSRSLLTIASHGKKKQQPFRCCALLTAAAGRRLLSPPSSPTHPITSRYVEVVRCASTARSAARPEGLHNEC